jgi:hypothetical protein
MNLRQSARIRSDELVGVTAAGQGKVHSNNDDPTGRHPGKTKAAFPKALNERADLVGQSYRERHRGQPALGLHYRPEHMGATLPYGVRIEESP